MGILLELPVVGVGKEGKRRKKSRAIKKGDKSPKGLLIMSAKIWAEKSRACLSGTMRDNLVETTIEIPLLKFLIRSTLISLVFLACRCPVLSMIKSASGPLPSLVFARLLAQTSDLSSISVLLPILATNPSHSASRCLVLSMITSASGPLSGLVSA